jgi:hypothetical protein
MPEHETYISMTFGELPDREEFIRHVQPQLDDGGFPMSLVDMGEINALCEAVNIGIDSHLEAVGCKQYTDTTYKQFPKWGLNVEDAGSMHTLLRRLIESDGFWGEPDADEDPPAANLASSIMYCLGYEWV